MRYAFADCILDVDQHLLLKDGSPVPVEPQVFDLLHLLVRNAGLLVSQEEIVGEVWNGRIVSDSTISARIAAARRAVGDDGKSQRIIQTISRRGLKWVCEVKPEPFDPPPGQTATQRIRYTQTPDGQSLAYAVTGSGPLVVRGGYTTTDLEAEWNTPSERAMFDAISAQYSLLRFDPVGFGRSDREMQEFSFDANAENLKTAADAAGFDRFSLYSESGGALVAIRFAAKYPERVRKLAILGGYADGRGRRGSENTSDALRTMAAEGWTAKETSYVSAMMLSYFPEGPLEVVHNMARNLLISSSEANILKIRDAIHRDTVVPLLPKIRCPTLIIHARHDAVHPLSEAQKLAAGIPDSELLVLETANHIPLLGNAVWEEFRQTLLDFLAE